MHSYCDIAEINLKSPSQGGARVTIDISVVCVSTWHAQLGRIETPVEFLGYQQERQWYAALESNLNQSKVCQKFDRRIQSHVSARE